jgi:endonuclease YncB( thermonuclease family)
LEWLRKYINGRRLRTYIYRRDQYGRVVASAKVRRGLLSRDVGLQMLRAGMATV